jgi:hypothetical protein
MENLLKIKVRNRLPGIVATLNTAQGIIEIYNSVHSGAVITRSKIDTLTGVFHPGIIVGEDIYGRVWVAHNHYKNKKPMFDTRENYLDGEQLIWDDRDTFYSKEHIVQRTIAEVRKGQSYQRINYNCQTFVNLIVRNEHRSESVDKLSNGAMWLGIILVILGLIFKNKGLTIAGAAAAGVGGTGKIYSRIG